MKFSTATAAVMLSLAWFATAQLPAVPIVQKIAPNGNSCVTDDKDCRTAKQAAPWIADGMYRYGIYSTKEMAAIISLMAFESGDFKYKQNKFPGRPGQGTANMQMIKYNFAYAKSIKELDNPLLKKSYESNLTDAEKNAVLDLVKDDKYNFASGPWFIVTYCANERAKLRSNIDEGFKAYMACVGVEVDAERQAYFNRAKQAFNLH